MGKGRAVVPRGGGDQLASTLFLGQGQQLVDHPAKLEGTCQLAIFKLEEDLGTRGVQDRILH